MGVFNGALSSITAPELAAAAIREALRRAGVKEDQVNEVILGNVLSAGIGQAPARQAALQSGLPEAVGATTINKERSPKRAQMRCASFSRSAINSRRVSRCTPRLPPPGSFVIRSLDVNAKWMAGTAATD